MKLRTKFVVNYEIKDKNIKIISNTGEYRIVKNTKANIRKLNKEIVKNKVAIANIIDEYEKTANERVIAILFNILVLAIIGLLVPFTLFMGIYLFFILAIILFVFASVTTLVLITNYYSKVKEIDNLKSVTGYKLNNEFKLSISNLVRK